LKNLTSNTEIKDEDNPVEN